MALRPRVGNRFLVTPRNPKVEPYEAKVTSTLGQYVYVEEERFHVLDDKVSPSTWCTRAASFCLLIGRVKEQAAAETEAAVET